MTSVINTGNLFFALDPGGVKVVIKFQSISPIITMKGQRVLPNT